MAGVVPNLVAVLPDTKDNFVEACEGAARMLGRLAVKVENRRAMAGTPGCLQTLADSLRNSYVSLQRAAVEVLVLMAADHVLRSKVAQLRGIFEGLVGLLDVEAEDGDAALKASLATARTLELLLPLLAVDRRSVFASPGAVHWVVDRKLVKILGAASLCAFQAGPTPARAALLLLSAVALDGEAGKAVLDASDAMRTLREVANAAEVPLEFRTAAGCVLRSLGRDVTSGEALPEGAPGTSQEAASGVLECSDASGALEPGSAGDGAAGCGVKAGDEKSGGTMGAALDSESAREPGVELEPERPVVSGSESGQA